jgi:hypothetical protein
MDEKQKLTIAQQEVRLSIKAALLFQPADLPLKI